MKSEQLYQELKDLAEMFEIKVAEHNLQKTGVRAQSGFCKVKGEKLFILDKSKSVKERILILASFLGKMPHEDMFVVPAVRDLLKKR